MGEGKDGCLRTEGRDGNLNEIINYKLYGIFDILMDYKHIFHESNFSKQGEAGRGQLAGGNSEAAPRQAKALPRHRDPRFRGSSKSSGPA